MLGGADRRPGAALLVRVVPAVRVSVAPHAVRHTLATGALKLTDAALLLILLGEGRYKALLEFVRFRRATLEV